MEDSEDLEDAMGLLAKQFSRVMNGINRRSKPNVNNMSPDIRKDNEGQRRTKAEETSEASKGVQCFGCEGYGHIRSECPTFLKRQKKSLSASWSDDEGSENESNDESAKMVTALTGRCVSDEEITDEFVSY